MKYLLYEDDLVFNADPNEKLQLLMNEFSKPCDGMSLEINVKKSKNMVLFEINEVEKFIYPDCGYRNRA